MVNAEVLGNPIRPASTSSSRRDLDIHLKLDGREIQADVDGPTRPNSEGL